jgi:hypothetical protein
MKSGTRIIEMLVPLCFRSSCQNMLRRITNFGNGAPACHCPTENHKCCGTAGRRLCRQHRAGAKIRAVTDSGPV